MPPITISVVSPPPSSGSISRYRCFCTFYATVLVPNLIFNFNFFWVQKAASVRASGGGLGFSSVAAPKGSASDPDQLKGAREDIKELLKSTFCHPILVSVFHCCMNYDQWYLNNCFHY